MKTKKTLLPFLLLLIVSLILVAAFFLPYTSMTNEERETVLKYPDGSYMGLKNSEIVDMSLVEYVRVFSYMAGQGQYGYIAIPAIVIISVLALFTLLILLFVCLRKAVPVIVFSLLDIGAFFLLSYDFTSRRVVNNGTYNFGFAYYVLLIGMIVIFALAIWLLVVKMINKKREKQSKVEAEN